jgi:hypothetical protein
MNDLQWTPTVTASIYVSLQGPTYQFGLQAAVEHVGAWCRRRDRSATVMETTFITLDGAAEKGVVVGLASSPRRPTLPAQMQKLARELGEELLTKCEQDVVLVVLAGDGTNVTYRLTREKSDG